MPPFPDEELPSVTLSLREFNATACQLLDQADDQLPFVRFVLAGRMATHAGEMRVNIDPTKNLTPMTDVPTIVSRDYDSIIGVSDNLPYCTPLSFYPFPNFKQSLSKTNHLTHPVRQAVSVSLHRCRTCRY